MGVNDYELGVNDYEAGGTTTSRWVSNIDKGWQCGRH